VSQTVDSDGTLTLLPTPVENVTPLVEPVPDQWNTTVLPVDLTYTTKKDTVSMIVVLKPCGRITMPHVTHMTIVDNVNGVTVGVTCVTDGLKMIVSNVNTDTSYNHPKETELVADHLVLKPTSLTSILMNVKLVWLHV
jgi:hypothetical protein